MSILVYTGAEVMVLRARPLWHTPFLPLNFALTAWLGALGAMFLVGRWLPGGMAALPVELLRRDHEKMQAGLHAIFDTPAPRDEMEARVLAYYSRLPQHDDAFMLWAEAKLLATRDAHFSTRFNAFMNEKRAELKAYIEEFSARVGTPLPLDPEILVIGLIALCDGVQLLATADAQRITAPLVEQVLAGFFSRVVFGRDP